MLTPSTALHKSAVHYDFTSPDPFRPPGPRKIQGEPEAYRCGAKPGKWALSAITAGGTKSAYGRKGFNFFTIRELLTPFEQTVRLCGMVYLPPFVISGTLLTGEAEIAKYARLYRDVIEGLRDGRFDPAEFQNAMYLDEILAS